MRLVSGASSGTAPKWARSNGATATWANTVAPRVAHTQRGRRCGHTGIPARIPEVAATDNWNPGRSASDPSATTSSATDHPSASHGVTWRPTSRPPSTSAAIRAARSTDGSQRVATTKSTKPMSPTRARRRGRHASGPATSHHAPRNKPTLLPDTAT